MNQLAYVNYTRSKSLCLVIKSDNSILGFRLGLLGWISEDNQPSTLLRFSFLLLRNPKS